MTKYYHPPHPNTPSIHILDEIKQTLMGNKNRTPEEQKQFEAVTIQMENVMGFQKQYQNDQEITPAVEKAIEQIIEKDTVSGKEWTKKTKKK